MWTWLQHVFLTVCRTYTDIVGAYTNTFADDQFAGLRTGLSSYTQIYPNWLLSSLTSNYKQGKNNSGVRLDRIFAALNFMFESERVVCVADDAPNLWHSWREHSGQSSRPVALRRVSSHSATDVEHSFFWDH